MDSIFATGTFLGRTITVCVTKENDNISITFNGKSDEFLMKYLDQKMEEVEPIGGTYYPSKNELLGYYQILNGSFFDKLINIVVEGEVEMIPYDDDPNIIY